MGLERAMGRRYCMVSQICITEVGSSIDSHSGPGQYLRQAPPEGPGSKSVSGLVDLCNLHVKVRQISK